MISKKVDKASNAFVTRDGEGHSVGLNIRHMPSEDGLGVTVAVGIDLGGAPVPSRRYAAEMCQVCLLDNELRLIFAQRSPSGEDLDSVLILRLNPKAAQGFIDSVASMSNPGLYAIAATVGIQPEQLHSINKNPIHPGNVANMIANFVAVGVSEYESCMDFYHASAFAMGGLGTKKELNMEPKVRVDIRTSLFLSMMEKAKEVVKSLNIND